ncbi:MAG: T9SS type A sorting domain-containing protein, partial [Bacteroidota bacterium]
VTNLTIDTGDVICLATDQNTAIDIDFVGDGTLIIASGVTAQVDEITTSGDGRIINQGTIEAVFVFKLPESVPLTNNLIFDNCGTVTSKLGLEIDTKFNNYPAAVVEVEGQNIIGTNGILTSNANMCITQLNGSFKIINNESVFSFCYFKNVGEIELLDDLIVDGAFVTDGDVLLNTDIVIKSSGSSSSTSEIVFRGVWRLRGFANLNASILIRAEEVLVEAPDGELQVNPGTEVIVMENIIEPSAPICDPVLPVELAFFKAQKNKNSVLLRWETLSELENDRFEVEKSEDAKDWKLIGVLEGAGMSLEVLDYQFLDQFPAKNNYYRLKQIDFDGQKTYSNVAYVSFDQARKAELHIFPNPSSHYIVVELPSQADGNVQIFDLNGKLLGVFPADRPIDIAYLSSGTYIVLVEDQGKIYTERFVKVL